MQADPSSRAETCSGEARKALRTDLPWADLVIDLSAGDQDELPDCLPALFGVRHVKNDGQVPFEGTALGILDRDEHASTSRGVLRWVDLDTGQSVALVWSQRFRHALSAGALSEVLGITSGSGFVRRHQVDDSTLQALQSLSAVGRLLRTPRWSGTAATWDAADAVVWLRFLLFGGITDPDERALLEEGGLCLEGDRSAVLGRAVLLRDAVGQGLTVAQVAEWWPLIADLGFNVARTGIQFGVRCSEVVKWQKTPLGVGKEVLGQEYLDARFTVLKVAADEGWTPAAFAKVAETAPWGCTTTTWMRVWTRFMPAELAGVYAAAGFSLEEAVRFHLGGDGVDMTALQTLAALRRTQ